MTAAIGPPTSTPPRGRGRAIVVCCADEDRGHVQPSVEILAGRGVTVELLETAHASADEITAAVRRSQAGTWAICESAVLDPALVDRIRSILFICGIDEEAIHRVALDWRNPLELFERLNALVPTAQPSVRVRSTGGASMPVDDDDDAVDVGARGRPKLSSVPKLPSRSGPRPELVAVPKPTSVPPTAPLPRSATMIGRPLAGSSPVPARAVAAAPAEVAAGPVAAPAEVVSVPAASAEARSVPPRPAAGPVGAAAPSGKIAPPARSNSPLARLSATKVPGPTALGPTGGSPATAANVAPATVAPTLVAASDPAPAVEVAASSPRPERLLGAPSPIAVAPPVERRSRTASQLRSFARWLASTTRSQRKIAGASVLGVAVVGLILSVAVDRDGDSDGDGDPSEPGVVGEADVAAERTLATGSNPDPERVEDEPELGEVRPVEIEAEIAAAETRGEVGRYREIVFAPTEPKRHNFSVSRSTCEQLEVGALDSWRLPTLGELDDLTRSKTVARDAYWSATESDAWGTRALVWNGRKVRASPVSKGWRGGYALCVLD